MRVPWAAFSIDWCAAPQFKRFLQETGAQNVRLALTFADPVRLKAFRGRKSGPMTAYESYILGCLWQWASVLFTSIVDKSIWRVVQRFI